VSAGIVVKPRNGSMLTPLTWQANVASSVYTVNIVN
jgi:hypothetical protein